MILNIIKRKAAHLLKLIWSAVARFLKRDWWEIITFRVPLYFFQAFGTILVIYAFKNFKEDTTSLTNYGFAILGGIATVSFNWARALDTEKEKSLITWINYQGERSLHAALLFLLASALKYATINISKLPKDEVYSFLNHAYVTIPLGIASSFVFTSADILATLALVSLNLALRKRIKVIDKII